MDRIDLWWDVAGPSAFLDRVLGEIVRGERVVCILAPDPRPAGLGEAIERRLRGEFSLDCTRLDMSAANQAQPIVHLLAEMLDIPVADIGTVSDFASHPGLSDQVVVVNGLQNSDLRRWSLFVRALAAEKTGLTVIGAQRQSG